MWIGLIGILFFVELYLVFNVIEEIIFGNRGREKHISIHYRYIRNTAINDTKRPILKKTNHLVHFTAQKYMAYALPMCIGIFLWSYFTFRSVGMSIILGLFGLIYPKTILEKLIRKKKETMSIHFKDALQSIMASLRAGLSINTALINVSDDLEKMLVGKQKDRMMVLEFAKIKKDLAMGVPLDETIKNFSVRMQNEDIDDFANSIITVKQKGGNMVEVMQNVTDIITDKIQIKGDIEVLTSAKRMEAKIISFMPVGIVMILSIISPHYLQPLYESIGGKVIIIFSFLMLAANYFIGKKIVDIQV